jgi:vacuolar-type H+-ATPase subunit C/Vma6
MVNGRTEKAQIWDLGAYAGIKLAGARDYEKVIASSRYAWVLPLLGTTPIAVIENKLDKEYYVRLLQLARALPAGDRTGVLRLVNLDIALANVIWALRLRFFYGMEWEKAQSLLIPGLVGAQRTAVARVFEMQPDSVEDWRKWKYAWLIEDQLGESFHSPDPVRAEQKASQRLYVRAHQMFHQNPFTLSPLVAYFMLKEHEVALLKTAVEAVDLSVAEQEVLALVGAS